jgi:16S rRNA (cytosine1402-N4)-methyltransferase
VSSLQLDSPERGFSFMRDGPLDMRMDPSSGRPPAARLVNTASCGVLRELIADLGEEPQAGRIARAIVAAREKSPLTRTAELAGIVEAAYPAAWRAKARNHPATRTFQALRLAVNDELGELETFLDRIVPRLAAGGRLAAISFHSLEDRAVKRFFRRESADCLCPAHVPVCVCGHKATLRVLTKKPVCASPREAAANPRAGSAKLRVAEKLAG